MSKINLYFLLLFLAYPSFWAVSQENNRAVKRVNVGSIKGEVFIGTQRLRRDTEYGGKWGYTNSYGNSIIPITFDFVGGIQEDRIAVNNGGKFSDIKDRMGVVGGKWGFYDVYGNQITELKFDFVLDFHEGYAAVCIGNVNQPGELYYTSREVEGGSTDFGPPTDRRRVTTIYKDVTQERKRTSFKEGGKWGFVDRNGKLKIDLIYDGVGSFHKGLAAVKLDGKWGFIDMDGNVIHPIRYKNITNFTSNIAFFCDSTSVWGILNSKGGVVCPPKYFNFEGPHNGLYKVEVDLYRTSNKYGFVDTNGVEIIPPIYGNLYWFENGLAMAQKGDFRDKYGYIDIKGRIVFPFIFDKAENFWENSAIVWKAKSGYCIIGSDGKYIVECAKKGLIVNNKVIENCSCGLETKFYRFKNGKATLSNIYVYDKVKKIKIIKNFYLLKDGTLAEGD